MGEITEVDLTRLRDIASRVAAAADGIAEMRWPTLQPETLAGSEVGRVGVPALVADRLTGLVANLRGWAAAAQLSADAFEGADRRNSARFGR